MRNAWLSVAATAVMVIALLIVGVAAMAERILSDTMSDLMERMSYSLYLNTETTDESVGIITGRLLALDSVDRIEIISPTDAFNQFREDNSHLDDVFHELGTLNRFPWIIRLHMYDYLEITDLQRLVASDRLIIDSLDPSNPPSFSDQQSNARATIEQIANMARNVERAGVIGGIAFIVIAILIVFNTIRMAIFHRKDEIYMMKLIGADRGFIRGPFIVEAILYGVFAGLISFGILIGILVGVRNLGYYGLAVDATYNAFKDYWWAVVGALLLLGVVIGIISSLLATRRYLNLHVKN